LSAGRGIDGGDIRVVREQGLPQAVVHLKTDDGRAQHLVHTAADLQPDRLSTHHPGQRVAIHVNKGSELDLRPALSEPLFALNSKTGFPADAHWR
jgi:hypothetical protein